MLRSGGFLALVLGILTSPSFAADPLCPGTDTLLYVAQSTSQRGYFEVRCKTEYYTPSNLDSRMLPSPIACAEFCHTWNSLNSGGLCVAGSYDLVSGWCFLKPVLSPDQRRVNNNVVTLAKSDFCL